MQSRQEEIHLIFRQSHIMLAIRLVSLEFLLFLSYLVIRIPKTLLITTINTTDALAFSNWIGIVWFLVLTIFELTLAALIILQWASEEYEIKEGVIYHRRGILQRVEDAYSLRELGSATLNQSILGKIFGFGTIRFYSPIVKQEFFLHNVQKPQEKLSAIDSAFKSHPAGRVIPRRH